MKDLIGLMTGENSNLLVGLLGILKAGCGFVPVDPTYPLERINYIVSDCGIEVLVTESRYLDLAWRISETHPTLRHVICLDDHTATKPDHVAAEFHEHGDWSRREATNEELNGDPDKVAYVIYTSGSTGRPKGVPITHRNLVPLLLWSRDYFNLGEHTKVLQNLSYCFDFGVFELLTTLIFGGTLYFPGKDKLLTSAAFVNEHSINTIHTTPSYFREITSSGAKFESLEILHLGGEQLTKSTVDYVFDAVGGKCELYNGYGPTEASVNCSIMRVVRSAELHHSAPIGRVTANNELYVLDRKGHPVPAGVAGELHVGGPGLAYGYLNRSRLTAEKFIPHAFGNEPGERLYKTGDLVRYRPDGNIEFLGRLDDQVKIRGYRIELGEIEAALVQHPSVQEAVVVPHDGVTGTRRLVAYVIDKDGLATTTSELRAFLKKRLPEYMVPSSFVKLESLPLTSSGKVERKALPAPDQSRPDLAETFVAPRSSDEEIIAGICGEVLAIDHVGVHDNLFDLGCHSILATKIVARLREALGVDLALTRIFEAPTVAELAFVCRDLNVAGTNLQLPPIQPVARNNGHLPLSFEQERIWFLDQLTENNISYYVPRALRIKGDFSVEVLERTFTELVRRHEILRTGFTDVGGQPVQIIRPPQPFKVNVIDLTSLNGEKESEAHRLVLAEGQKLFDLDQPPLVRVTLLQLDKDDHVLSVTEHHLVHDGWTQGVLLAEFLTLYPALAAGKPSPLPELPFQYADFAAWERKCWQGEFVEAQLSYWKKQLAGAPALLDVPTDRPRPPVQSFRGDEQQLVISSQLAESLRAFSRREGVTLFMTMLAVFKVLLSRYSGQLDMVVGTAIANRRCVEIEGMLGMIVNTVVLRTDLSGDLTFREALKRVRKVCLEAYAHQDMPFEKLVEALQPQRTLSHMPIFQAMFGFLDTPMRTLELPGMSLELMESHNHSAKFDLNVVFVLPAEQRIGLNLGEVESEITGLFEYNTDIFDYETISRMLGHYHTLLESVVQHPEVRISELQLVTESERQQLLTEWNDTQADYARELCMHQFVEAYAERTPDAVAVVDREAQLSYAEVNRRANQLAHYLRKHGVGPETLVAVVLERSARMIVSLLAILKAGGAYLPLDPNNPKEHIGYMLADAGVQVVITGEGAKEHLTESEAHVIDLDADAEEIAGESDANPVSVTTATNLAYVIYTSGSTGRPKGVELQHRGLVNLVTWHRGAYEVNSATRATQVARQTFDASVWEIWSCLGSGGSLYLVDEETILSPAQLWTWLATHQITHCFLPTPLAEAVLPHVSREAGALKYLLIGGDKLHQGAAASLPFTLVNLYGPTENTVVSTSAEVSAASETGRAPSIGRPIANSEAYVLDEQGAPVPVGVAGELYVGGEGLARGYLKRAALTAERFVPHPYSREKGARLYRTGDVVRWLASGELEFLGRQDEQVKVRGYRIELGEIEALLGSHPEVSEAAVLVSGEGEQRRLVAYVVAKDEATELTMTQMRNYLQEKLPDYMIPTALVQMAELPMTPNGKVDRRALPEPELDRGSLGTEYAAPSTAAEEILVNIWSEVLGVAQVGTYDNFFDLGGHSLLATQVISRVRQAFSIELPLRALFESPTVLALAMQVEAVRQLDEEVLTPSLRAVERIGNLPLSFAQQRLWFIDQFDPGLSTYNIPAAVRLSGELNVTALERALSEVVRRHEALRTTFHTVDGLPVQRITEAHALQLPLVDLSELGAPEVEVERLASEEAQLPFDLSVGPLLRAQLLRVSAEEHVVLITMHHIVSDGWSTNLLVSEVSRLYEAYRSGQESPLPELPIQYADYAAWQSEWLSGDVLEKELAYWREQLAGAPTVLDLPADHVRPPVQTFRGALKNFVIDASVAEGINALSRREGATLFMTLLAAFKTLLYRYSGQTSVVVGTPIAGRTQVEVEELIGFFVNTLVLRTDVSGDLSFTELLRQVKEVALGAYAHQEVPFEKLVEELEPERSLSHTPLFQVAFVMQNEERNSRLEMTGLQASLVRTQTVTAKFDLTLQLTETEAGLNGAIEYNTDLYEAETIERMLGHYQTLLQSIVSQPDQRVCELGLLTESETEQLLEWNETEVAYLPQCIHELFEAQAARTSKAVALVFADAQVSYGDLNRRANKLAHHLRELGVGPETLVAVLLDRSVDLVIGLLGVLKAGGAYVPIDPEYPAERVHYMLADCGARVLLTQAGLAEQVEVPDGCAVVQLDHARIAQQSDANVTSTVSTENLAYVIYTSGSTGKPKGAMNTHRALCNRLLWMQEAYQLDNTDRVLQKTSMSFDVSGWEFFWPLITGARLILAQPGGQRDSAYLVQLIAAEQITTVHFVPSMLEVFLQEQDVERCGHLKRVICSGEALTVELQQRFFARFPSVQLENLYGPTEAAIDVSRWSCERESERRVVPIGRPIANLRLYVLDEEQRLVPVGVTGELYIGGVGVGRGYLGRAALTAERFVPDPFSESGGERLYRTGDDVRIARDGQIEYLGRRDGQVKLRGFRIELGEIESALNEHAAVQQAVVVAREESTGNKRLVAYVVPDQRRAAPINRLLSLEAAGQLDGLVQFELPNEMTIVCRNRNETEFMYDEIFGKKTYSNFGITVPTDACIFDVGANIGLFSLFASRLAQQASIYSFEPIPPVFEILRLNTEIHGLKAKLFEFGLSNVSEASSFTYYPNVSLMSGRFADVNTDTEVVKSFVMHQQQGSELASAQLDDLIAERLMSERITCQLKTLSEVIRDEGVTKIDLLKIDVEKGELEVLNGIDDLDWPKIDQIVMEVHDLDGRVRKVTELLSRHGFKINVDQDAMLEQTSLYNLYASRNSHTQTGSQSAGKSPTEFVWSSRALFVKELREHLTKSLPLYMVPSAFVEMERLPLTPNGKVDRRALPEPELDRAKLRVEYAGPRTAVEEILVNIWSEVLNVPQVGIHDNFFELGGHSLLATQVISRISKTFRAELPIRRLFEQPTIAVLAATIEESHEKQKGRVAPRIPTARRKTRSLERLLTEVVQFSDTEVESLLQAKSSSSSQAAVHKKAVG